MVLGFIFGFGCAAIAGLALVIAGNSGVVDLGSFLVANRPTATAFIITATPPPATPTLPPTEVLITPTLAPTLTPTVEQIVVQPPTATPTSNIPVAPSATPTTQAAPIQSSQTQGGSTTTRPIPALLQGKLTPVRRITGGTFEMGTTAQEVAAAVNECVNVWNANCSLAMGEDSFPPHKVTVDSYDMEVTEVTYEQYLAFLNSTDAGMGPNSHKTGCEGQICLATRAESAGSNVIFDSANYRVVDAIKTRPVVGVTWYGARAYCAAIGRRLPSEAEWERAGRGPNNNLYPWGNTFDVTFAKTSRPRVEPELAGSVDVGSYPAGASLFGLLDMGGNVAEWVSDWYSPNYYNQVAQSGQAPLNPSGPPAGTEKVVRGGSWDTPPFFARSIHRQSREPQNPAVWLGFRCVQDIQADAAGGGAPATNNSGAGVNPTVAPAGGSAGTGGGEEDTSGTVITIPPPPGQPTPLLTLPPG
jgi:formylglycine-generating enzyme required for sulfatase activity